ncbi:hypothetical protein HanXRQr2_Chr12g0534791 [Helianthus annuus]|uniref:Uncharacterized protein n=1 Tax=Helianthus annuus TaxID=4232 RepID=A0A9K3MVG7_HELAN|nr:hypothetical protein HanXRQr2_Chr12g0534791 [Helianthus annuus]KAJ0862177.1 hypothetical protein HanPSC8_Chr12g0515121 [Helianthus annuus]
MLNYQRFRIRRPVITVDWNKSCDTAPKGSKKWLILSNKLN